MVQKNNPVASHTVSLLLRCGHVIEEELEAVIYLPRIGNDRYCAKHKAQTVIVRVGNPVWQDRDEQDE